MCVSVALSLLAQTSLAEPMGRTDGQISEEAASDMFEGFKSVMEEPEHLIEKEFSVRQNINIQEPSPSSPKVEKRRKRSVNLMQIAIQ